MIYLIVDCYPQSGSDDFRNFAGAVIGCWIRSDLCSSNTDAYTITERKLDAIGWTIARIVNRDEVSAETYDTKNEGREFFEQAQIDGFVANLHVCERELVGDTDINESNALVALGEAAGTIMAEGGVSLYSRQAKQWAVGVTPAGANFVPLWQKRDHAVKWLQRWPGYLSRDVSRHELRGDLLGYVNEGDMWIGLCISRSVLITCHPIWLKNLPVVYSA